MKTMFEVRQESIQREHRPKTTIHVMKTKSIATVLTAALAIAFTASAYAAPPGKGTTLKKADAPKVERKIGHTTMHRVGPAGKGYICRH